MGKGYGIEPTGVEGYYRIEEVPVMSHFALEEAPDDVRERVREIVRTVHRPEFTFRMDGANGYASGFGNDSANVCDAQLQIDGALVHIVSSEIDIKDTDVLQRIAAMVERVRSSAVLFWLGAGGLCYRLVYRNAWSSQAVAAFGCT